MSETYDRAHFGLHGRYSIENGGHHTKKARHASVIHPPGAGVEMKATSRAVEAQGGHYKDYQKRWRRQD